MAWTAVNYAYVLGLYLGDGNISRNVRTYSLRITMDAKYPGIVAEVASALRAGLPNNGVSVHNEGPGRTKTVLSAWSRHMPCLFPQHGPGPKHKRSITLETWQQAVVDEQPWPFLRGLVQSDGCRFINRTGKYSYPSYDFTQVSDDIRRMFADACDRVGVKYRYYRRRVRIYDRASVALMDARIGPKH